MDLDSRVREKIWMVEAKNKPLETMTALDHGQESEKQVVMSLFYLFWPGKDDPAVQRDRNNRTRQSKWEDHYIGD